MGLDATEMLMECEERFGIAISDSDARRVRTVRDLVDLVHAKATVRPSAGDRSGFARVTRDDTEAEVFRIVSEQLGLPRADVRPELDFVGDLGL